MQINKEKRNVQDEIRSVAKMMKIDIQNHDEYIGKVESMLKYFDILDSAGVLDENITMREITVSCLRKDKHVASSQNLIQKLGNRNNENYIKAPMVM